MCAQEAKIEESSTCTDTRNYEESKSEGYLSGCVHCRSRFTKTYRDVQVSIYINLFCLANCNVCIN